MIEFLKKVPIFSNLEEKECEKIIKISKLKKFQKKEVIFEDGEKAKGFYIVYSGKVKIYKISFDGKEQILHIFGKFHIFGEVPVFADRTYPANAITLENSELLFVPKEEFIHLIEEYPQIALNMLSILSMRLHTFTSIIENLSLKEVPARLASFLIFQYKEKNKINITLSISKNQLASLLGTIPETLSRILNKFSQQGILTIDGKSIKINNIEKLFDIADGIVKL